MTREDGLYWVRDRGEWDVVAVVNGYAYLPGSDFPLGVEDFTPDSEWRPLPKPE
jgi:hypothetical protein